jgi:hypothetical protein
MASCDSAKGSLNVVMNSVADILEAEGRGQPLPAGAVVELEHLETADTRVILRNSARGGVLFLAERKRFPILFEVLEAVQAEKRLTTEQCAIVQALAAQADLAQQNGGK